MLHSVAKLTPYELVDIGSNLCHPSYKDDLADVLKRAKQAGISKIMITGTNEEISQECAQLAETQPGFLYFTAGLHPHDAKHFSDSTIAMLRKIQCKAVGECGLDYNRLFSPKTVQKDVFMKQVELACELQKPLFIHEREAHCDMVEILSQVEGKLPTCVIHCFTGTVDEAKKYIEMGLYIGLTGFLWKDRSNCGVQVALSSGIIPLERLVIETDAPFMYPKINDKKLATEITKGFTEETRELHKYASFSRNEPCALAAVCELIAGFMKKDPKVVAEITSENAKKIYNLY